MGRTPRLLAAALLIGAVPLFASCTNDSPSSGPPPPPPRVEPSEWLPVACDAFTGIIDIQEGELLASDANLSVDTEKDRQELRQRLVDTLADRRAEILKISKRLAKAGIPTSRGGALLVQEVQRGLSQVGERYDRIRAQVSQVPAGTLELFEAGMQSAMADLDQGAGEMEAARDVIFADPAMSELISTTKACKGV